MYTFVSGLFANGQLTLPERASTNKKSKVAVTFLGEVDVPESASHKSTKRRLGGLEGKITLPDDFNKPLNDLID